MTFKQYLHDSYLLRIATFMGLMSVCYAVKDNSVRSVFIYLPTIYFFFAEEVGKYKAGYLLAAVHGLVHVYIPFIDHTGINTNHSAGWDVFVHLVMLVYAVHIYCEESLIEHLRSKTWKARFELVVILGSLLNFILGAFSEPDEPWFVYTSIFQALSTGYFVAVHLSHHGKECIKHHASNLPLLVGFLTVASFNWGLFRSNHDVLADAFLNRYFETLFIIPTWIFYWSRHH